MGLPVRSSQGTTSIQVVGNENLFAIASKYLGDPWQWWRISDLNLPADVQPDFIVAASGTLMLPAVNPNASSK